MFITGVKVNHQWIIAELLYTILNCMVDFLEEYPEEVFDYNGFIQCLDK